MSDLMTDVIAARTAYLAARDEVTRTKLELGRAILIARSQHVPMKDIAEQLELTREQVRRIRYEYEQSLAKPA